MLFHPQSRQKRKGSKAEVLHVSAAAVSGQRGTCMLMASTVDGLAAVGFSAQAPGALQLATLWTKKCVWLLRPKKLDK